jgi:hypothetical protein
MGNILQFRVIKAVNSLQFPTQKIFEALFAISDGVMHKKAVLITNFSQT